MSLVPTLASLPDTALMALAHGMRSGGLTLGSSSSAIAGMLGVDAEMAIALRTALQVSGIGDPATIALAADVALESRRGSALTGLSSVVEIVLSGPLVEGVEMRDTAAVFASLMREAREEVLVTSFVAARAKSLLLPLAEFLETDPARKATVVLNFKRGKDRTIESDLVARLADNFWRYQWPDGYRRPKLCYDPRGLSDDEALQVTMHAKVVVVDRRKAFVTSANLTARAQNENIELGVLVNHAATAARITGYFEALIASGGLIAAC